MKLCASFGVGALLAGLLALPGVSRAQQEREHRAMDLSNLPSPMEAVRNLQNTGRMLFVLADTNHDGEISQQEAIDASHLLAGGLFFRADADGNGVVTDAELKAMTDRYLQQDPWLKYIADSLKAQTQQRNGQNGSQPAIPSLVMLIDTNNDRQIQATELRQFVQSMTQSFFAAADTNRNGQISPSEVNASVVGIVKSVGEGMFQQADTDHNNQLSRAEFDKALVEPANVFFQIVDLNHDGEISQQEANQAVRVVGAEIRRLQLPEPPNSPTNIFESGRLPRETAPVPTFTAPNVNPNANANPTNTPR